MHKCSHTKMKFMLIIMWSYWTECYQNDLFKEALTLPNYYSIAENGISSRGLEKGVSSTLQMISRVNIVPSPKTGVLARWKLLRHRSSVFWSSTIVWDCLRPRHSSARVPWPIPGTPGECLLRSTDRQSLQVHKTIDFWIELN